MAIKFTPEKELENNLIEQLTRGESQWNYRADLTTEAQLWDNLFKIVEQNNRRALKGHPLTEREKNQIRAHLTFPNAFEAAKWIAGENGVAKIPLQREDASLGIIQLLMLNRADIAGGTTVYEVINQYQGQKQSAEDRRRDFDVTLLINGIPLIHIELKNRQHPYMDAFRQIKKYIKEGKFQGLFSAVQMFVVSNGSDTRYIAAAGAKQLNASFLSKWVDHNNNPVTQYLDFAEEVLSIPAAHKMVTQYAITDRDKEALILLRPYQIHAIEAIKRASKIQKSGYVWHTTGSGKTLTSYKVACNLLQIPQIDKTIFIVDRVDLDQQTTSSFTSYAEFDPVAIEDTDNVNELINRLASNDRTVVITTIQKLNHLMRRMEEEEISSYNQRRYEKIKNLKVAFIVDECHRAVTPQKKEELDRYFHYALWYGFTGTPIFAENARAEQGRLARTTEEQYGGRLHEYTVKEAINDKAVLGFQVEYQSTLDDEEIDEIIEHHHPEIADDFITGQLTEEIRREREKLIPREYYDQKKHRLRVIDFIINKSTRKLGFTTEGGKGRAYGAILTVSSINAAQEYYDLFKSVIAGNESVKISRRTSSILPDFPKVAITYSISENEESSIHNQEKMKESLQDYNACYGTNFTLETIRSYNQDVNNRLARKRERYQNREEQIDIIIVVDRLLTGFDAPAISTLFIDRPPMRPHDLIQAFSRTNRLFDSGKAFGQIVTFQTPIMYEEKVKEALILYSNGGENAVLAPDWDEAKKRLDQAVEELRLSAETPEVVQELPIKELRTFVRAFQKFDRSLSAAMTYFDYGQLSLEEEYDLSDEEIEEYHGVYQNALERLRKERKNEDEVELLDIDYTLQTHKLEEINYRYILSLIQKMLPQQQEKPTTSFDAEEYREIDEYIERLHEENPKLSAIMGELWEKIKVNPEAYRDQNIYDLLESMVSKTLDHLVQSFAKKWGLQTKELRFLIDNYNPNREEQTGETELRQTSDYEAYKAQTETPVSRLRYWRAIKEALTELIVEDVLPLRMG